MKDKFAVVDVFDRKDGPLVLTLRSMGVVMPGISRHWTYMSVQLPKNMSINFGDIIEATREKIMFPGVYKEDGYYLRRGPHLTYRLHTVPMSSALAAQLINECPANVGPGDFPELDYFPH